MTAQPDTTELRAHEPLLISDIRRRGQGIVEYHPDRGPKAGTHALGLLAEFDALLDENTTLRHQLTAIQKLAEELEGVGRATGSDWVGRRWVADRLRSIADGTARDWTFEGWCGCEAHPRVHPHKIDRAIHEGRPCPTERVDPLLRAVLDQPTTQETNHA